MSDNELDNLFKEAAEGFKPPQDESAWKQMANRLDQHAVRSAGFWNWKTISGVAIIGFVSITAVWYAATENKQEISITRENHESNNPTQGVVQEQKEQTHPAGQQNIASAQSVEDKSSGVNVVTHSEQKAKGVQVSDKQISGKSISGSLNDREDQSKKPVNTVALNSDEMTGGPDANVPVKPAEHNPAVSGITQRGMVTADDSVARDSVARIAALETIPVDSAKTSDKDKNDERKASHLLSIKAAVSPDFSSVNFFSAGKTGINYGLLVGYSFNNRWSVYTGVISSKKLYDTKDVEGAYSSNGHDYPVKELDGDCRILDIPINIYYTFFPERSFSIRAGLGFSSYIMRQETYVYCVDNYGDDVYYKQEVNGENNEWFKVMNVSVALSKRITNRWSAEFEPFVKAPLTGVGEGKVSLVSMGAFINLKYDLILFK